MASPDNGVILLAPCAGEHSATRRAAAKAPKATIDQLTAALKPP